LPDHELNTFLTTVADAVDVAREGDPAEGYTAPLAGLHRAREAEADGEVWAGELGTRYRDALERFAEMYAAGRT